MKKLLIVNNNLKVGGVQKSLYNLLWSLEGEYDITLCLFKNIGDYSEKLPKSVKVTETKGLFRYLGVSQSEVKGLDGIKRAILAAVSRMLGRKFTLKLLLLGEKTHDDNYDCAISFLHNGKDKSCRAHQTIVSRTAHLTEFTRTVNLFINPETQRRSFRLSCRCEQ